LIGIKPDLDQDHGGSGGFNYPWAMDAQDRRQQPAVIELQVDRVGQLFDTLDPTPFREKDLDRQAEEYIVSWARELPRKSPVRILVHMPAAEASGEHAQILKQAMSRYFSYRAEIVGRDLSELFRTGRAALLVGLAVLILCVTGGRLATATVPGGQFGATINEGLIILGWVANWRPIEIFLYDWWPIVRHRNLLQRLSRADIVIVGR
jgi:hypothetical protein